MLDNVCIISTEWLSDLFLKEAKLSAFRNIKLINLHKLNTWVYVLIAYIVLYS